MRTLTMIPAHTAVSVIERDDRQVALATFAGSGRWADVIVELVLDPAGLAALEAQCGEARDRMRLATAA
jgi:hypothetical protein